MNTQKLAAIDIGSNSIKLAVTEAAASDLFTIVYAEKDPVRLGHETLRARHLSQEATTRAAVSINRLRQIAETRGATKVLAVATASVRAADNQTEFIESVERQTGVRVAILSAVEEARLIGVAVSAFCGKNADSLINVDIGGGSTELSVMRGGEPEQLFSMKLGAVGLTEAFLSNDPPTEKQLHDLRIFIKSQLARPVRELAGSKWTQATGTSGTILALGRSINFENRADNQIALDRLAKFNERAARMRLGERLQIPEISQQRAEIIIAGGQILEAAMRTLKIKTLRPCEYALREGVIIDYLRQVEAEQLPPVPDVADNRLRGVFAVGRRFNYDENHSLQIAALAERIFDRLALVFGLQRHDRTLLSAAALLHDIGYAVAHSEYHKHSLYLIKHSELTGFSESERLVIANVARYHRGKMPTDKHPDFMALGERDRQTARRLGAILKLADGLDKSCGGAVESIEFTRSNQDLLVEIGADACETDFETVRTKADLFEATFNCRLVFLRRPQAAKI